MHGRFFVSVGETVPYFNKFCLSCEFHKLFIFFFSVSIPPTNEGGKLVTYFNMAPGGVPVFLSHSKHRVEPHSLHSSCFIL